MGRLIEVFCENTGSRKKYELGTSLCEVIKDQNISLSYPVLGAMVNNRLKELSYEIFKPKTIRFFDITSLAGQRMYLLSLCFVLYKAASEIFPDNRLKIEHMISGGLYCEIEGLTMNSDNGQSPVDKIRNRMGEIIQYD